LIALMIDVRRPLQDVEPRSEKTMLANHARANAPLRGSELVSGDVVSATRTWFLFTMSNTRGSRRLTREGRTTS
jgi:hypothetical protein